MAPAPQPQGHRWSFAQFIEMSGSVHLHDSDANPLLEPH
jgi:hypothetical protein